MSKLLRGRITFSNAIAVLALFVALGGSAYAATKFSGKQIKPKTIPANRIKPNSLSSKQIKDGSLKGVKSAISLNNITYQTVTATLDSTNPNPITTAVTCPAGLHVTGGGGVISDPNNGFINDTGPTPGNTGWVVHSFSGAVNSTITVTAICASASSTTP
jgi:hypothetical protein